MNVDCINTNDGALYVGKLNKTISGKTCQRWDVTTPHSHSYTTIDHFATTDVDMDEVGNYCRNPGNDFYRPWCYITDPDVLYESCDVPYCTGNLQIILLVHVLQ